MNLGAAVLEQPKVEHLQREAALADITILVDYLQEHLGQRMTAYLAGIRDEKMVGQWAKGRNEPRELSKHRLRLAYQAAHLLVDAFGNETARAWFFGTNSRLGGEAPASVLRKGRTPDDLGPVLRAACAFVTG